MRNTYRLGIDIGSTTVKIAILDDDDKVLFSDYERHFANIQETLASLLKAIFQKSIHIAYYILSIFINHLKNRCIIVDPAFTLTLAILCAVHFKLA